VNAKAQQEQVKELEQKMSEREYSAYRMGKIIMGLELVIPRLEKDGFTEGDAARVHALRGELETRVRHLSGTDSWDTIELEIREILELEAGKTEVSGADELPS
jgi:hypothetical protein